MSKRFLGNMGGKKLHALDYADKRCKLNMIKEENKVFFSSFQDGISYPNAEHPIFKECGICIPKYKKSKEKEK